MLVHDVVAEHVTLQLPAPHWTTPHVLAPLHVTAQDAASVHTTVPHEFDFAQSMVQFHPAGHVTVPLPPSIVHVIFATSHDVHAFGQPPLPAPSKPVPNTQ